MLNLQKLSKKEKAIIIITKLTLTLCLFSLLLYSLSIRTRLIEKGLRLLIGLNPMSIILVLFFSILIIMFIFDKISILILGLIFYFGIKK